MSIPPTSLEGRQKFWPEVLIEAPTLPKGNGSQGSAQEHARQWIGELAEVLAVRFELSEAMAWRVIEQVVERRSSL